ncbi:MAG TPA: hypothetical protein ENJ12_09475 [Thiolapillus brandeum]|uniref:Uncharacterized protein n=1 Tax=Thiolapillus brandeum TaxID=1076588 RepID=A0A831WG06_9GAMM|nr:hypothetical protein [Thiolapillus brandeum]
MNDGSSYNFSFSYNLATAPAAPAEEDLTAFDDCMEFPLPGQRVLLRSRSSGKQITVTNDVAYSLRLCREFRTLSEHIQHVGREIPELRDEPDDIRQVLNSIGQAGLMLSASAKTQSIKPVSGFQPAETALCYCILSCDRSEALARLLESMAANHRFLGTNRYYVIDDSRKAEKREKNRAICRDFSAAHGVKLHYFGIDEQARVLQQLQSQLPEHAEGIAFLLGRYGENPAIPSYGRTRNWGLLLSRGSKLVLVDDDILFQRVSPPTGPTGPEITSRSRVADFFGSDNEWQTLLDPENTDPSAGSFSQALGASLGETLSLLGEDALPQSALRNLYPADFAQVQPDSKILLTACGYAGDPGTASNIWIYQLPAQYRGKLFSSEQDYRRHIRSRNTWMGSFGPAFRNQFSLMSPLTGIDCARLTPPFFPLLRNEDLLFGVLLHHLHPDALFLDNPWAVPHLPAEHRQWEQDLSLKPQNYGLLDFSADALVLDTPTLPAGSASDRLRGCAGFFSGLSRLDDRALEEKIAEQTLGLRTTQISRLAKVLDESHEAPGFWQQDLQRIIEAGEQSLAAPLPRGFQAVPGGEDEQKALARTLWKRYAQGIRGWEACLNTMQDIQIEAS